MPELDEFPPARGHVDPAQIQRNVLEEQVELWWFREPRKSLLCYCASVLLVLGCGLGGVGLLSTTTSLSSELCLLALAVLLKQLLSSAIQDMNCVRSRRRIEVLKSGGISDLMVILLTGLALAVCGTVLLNLALANGMPQPGLTLNDMFISGVVLLVAGCLTVLSVALYCAVVFFLHRTCAGQRLRERGVHVFSISGEMNARQRETTSSMANLI
ncbi:TM125 protein, partial [Amia calva]|nr:TM125 protein [Amia calva]